jgi:hypothetical protein
MDHRYQKSLNRLLKVCYVPATSAVLIAFFSSFFAAAINSNNGANKAAGIIKQSIYLDVYDTDGVVGSKKRSSLLG